MAGRRAQLRATLEQEILDAALAELRHSGPSELSLREVARRANISPAGIYRYVDGRDGLLELLIADGFHQFGEFIDAAISAAGEDFLDRTRALAKAYRQWASDNPEQFALILGSPIVGFHAEPGGATEDAVRRFGMPMLALLAEARTRGQLTGIDESGAMIDLTSFGAAIGTVPVSLVDTAIRSWARIHGVVVLEAFGHVAWSARNIDELLDAEARSIVASFG